MLAGGLEVEGDDAETHLSGFAGTDDSGNLHKFIAAFVQINRTVGRHKSVVHLLQHLARITFIKTSWQEVSSRAKCTFSKPH